MNFYAAIEDGVLVVYVDGVRQGTTANHGPFVWGIRNDRPNR